jgi:hypothetical protein
VTGGWGTPRVSSAAAPRAALEREKAALMDNVLTGACGDDLHEHCQGHLMGALCCCTCHKEAAE